MRLNCTIDGTDYSFNVSSDKPLSRILQENIQSFAINSQCKGSQCGNCIVMVNSSCVLSCLVPAFKLNGATILTYEGFSKTLFCHDIEKAYSECGVKPCSQCYASKTFLIASIVEKIERNKQYANLTKGLKIKISKSSKIDSVFIAKEISINSCKCMELSQIIKIIKLVCQYRRSHNAK